MRHFKVAGVVVVAMFAFGLMVTSALALPDVHVLSGESYPLHLNYSSATVGTKLVNTGGSKLKGEGLKLLLLWTALSALGTWEATFSNVKNGTTACNSVNDAAETVLVSGEVHVVELAPKGSKKAAGLFLFNELEIICGKVKVKVKGSVLSNIIDPKAEECVELLTGELTGNEKGKNTFLKYVNDTPAEVEGKLEANFGTGFLQASEETAEPVHLVVLEGKMFSILEI
jgi:hypothetical protein